MKRLRKWLKRLDRALGRWESPGAPLRVHSEQKITEGLLSARGHPIWDAVLGLLDEQILEVSDRPLDEVMNDQAVRFHLGGQAALLEFKELLLRREAEAREKEEERTRTSTD